MKHVNENLMFVKAETKVEMVPNKAQQTQPKPIVVQLSDNKLAVSHFNVLIFWKQS